MPEYAVLDKDTIKIEIMPYISVAKRGFAIKFDIVEIVNAILYKLKSGCQWRMLPLGHLFTGEPPSWNTVFHHYRKWSNAGEWKTVFTEHLKRNKDKIDLSLSHLDGSQTPVYRAMKRLIIKDGKREIRRMPFFLETVTDCHSPCPSHKVALTQTSSK